MRRGNAVAVVGATEAVGETLLQILEERKFPLRTLRLFASERSAGRRLRFHEEEVSVEPLTAEAFRGIEFALFSAGAARSTEFAPAAAGFTAEYLNDPKNIEEGRAVWVARCQFCHGKTAYPGKAPRLDPSRYAPEFVYDRVANGFGGMPPWRHEFSDQALRAVVAYVLSREFPN